ncbi:alpha/beta hydrolase [Lysobacter sp. cf310]|uniref:alpha/beta hydrolase n=1 Tax=Lysobacter sp. cf310 TaxID=1761790 RepID=UPI0008DFEFB1|nr:alpha/beta fold hydrolase [Lysobacter sp. cf310]SFK35199.1 Alpha/beta hydrolase family protein [Lysobacter sp. cf310]
MAARAPIRHLLLVHGAGGGAWEWSRWCEVLRARGLAAQALELHAADAGLAATGFDDYVVQVRAVFERLPRPRALIGASLGGLLALPCADAADALVLINPLPPAPWAARLPARAWPPIVPWHRDARLASTRRALPDADEAAALYAYRRWRDESGAVLRAAQDGIAVAAPVCATLCVASAQDEDVPPELTAELAAAWGADCLQAPSPSHVGPLLGRGASELAGRVADWLSAR